MTKNYLNYLKTTIVILLYLCFSMYIVKFLKIIGIDYTNLKINYKLTILTISDFLLIIAYFLLYYKDYKENLKNFKKNFKEYFKFGLKYWLIGLFVMIFSNIIISLYFPGGSSNENGIQSLIKFFPIYMFISSSICAPIIEETIFRKSIRTIVENDILYIFLSGFIFGFVHTLAGNSIDQLLYIIPYGFIGSCFAYMYFKTNNIFVSMTFHFIHNFIAVMISIITYYGGIL